MAKPKNLPMSRVLALVPPNEVYKVKYIADGIGASQALVGGGRRDETASGRDLAPTAQEGCAELTSRRAGLEAGPQEQGSKVTLFGPRTGALEIEAIRHASAGRRP